MRVRVTGSKLLLIGSFLALSLPLTAQPASASTASKSSHAPIKGHPGFSHAATRHEAAWHGRESHATAHGRAIAYRTERGHAVRGHAYARWSGISCVPYARSKSGIDVPGNAWQWWNNAAGRYARGSRPEPGSVLSFDANPRMRLGHVAVVSRVINPREIEVDQANWMSGGVSHNVPVVDVSENNDWTAVRVGLGQSGDFGSVYPTNGFIYDKPDNGRMVAAVSTPAPTPTLNPAPGDLRSYAQRADFQQTYDEVAEAPPVHPIVRRHYVRHTHKIVAQR